MTRRCCLIGISSLPKTSLRNAENLWIAAARRRRASVESAWIRAGLAPERLPDARPLLVVVALLPVVRNHGAGRRDLVRIDRRAGGAGRERRSGEHGRLEERGGRTEIDASRKVIAGRFHFVSISFNTDV
jgi:hypothetical protein